MTEEKNLLDIPDFIPEYEQDVQYGYENKAGENLEKLLRKTSKNHCMYCYALLKSDRSNTGHMEHSIEKSLSENYLKECVPNIAIACTDCNLSLKRSGEKKRVEAVRTEIPEFEKNLVCLKGQCRNECSNYKELKRKYCDNGKIILQPFGVTGKYSRLKYQLQYDVEAAEFIPSKKVDYDQYDREFIKHHINQFRLNDSKYRTKALAEFIEDVIEADGKYRKEKEYSNYIVDLFKEKLEGMDQEMVFTYCRTLYMKYLLNFKNYEVNDDD